MDEKDDKIINLRTDDVNIVCKDCMEKCKQSSKVTVICCPTKTKQRS